MGQQIRLVDYLVLDDGLVPGCGAHTGNARI